MSLIGAIRKVVGRAVNVWAEYVASPPTLADGDMAPLQCTADGSLKVSPAALSYLIDSVGSVPAATSSFASTARENTKVVLASGGGRLVRASVTNAGATTRYLQVHNRTSVSAGNVPIRSIPIDAGLDAEVFFLGRIFDVGIALALSTTQDTYTAPGGAEGWFEGEYLP
jgi:hypothetical protein